MRSTRRQPFDLTAQLHQPFVGVATNRVLELRQSRLERFNTAFEFCLILSQEGDGFDEKLPLASRRLGRTPGVHAS